MEIFETHKRPLQDIWKDDKTRADAKQVIAYAIAQASNDISANTVYRIGLQLDELLLPEEKQDKVQRNKMV